MDGLMMVLLVYVLSLLLAELDGPVNNAAPSFESVELTIDEKELGLEPVGWAPVLLALVVLAAVFNPALFWNLVGLALVPAEDM